MARQRERSQIERNIAERRAKPDERFSVDTVRVFIAALNYVVCDAGQIAHRMKAPIALRVDDLVDHGASHIENRR